MPDLLGPIDRRRFLAVSARASAALAAGALLPAGCAGYPSISDLRTFTPKEYAVLAAIADVTIGATGDMPTPDELGIARYLDAYLAAEPEFVRTQLKRALLLFEYGGCWFGPGRARFTHKSPAAQAAYLRGWLQADSAFRRQVAQTLRRACANAYYSNERTWTAIGYDGPFVGAETAG